MITSNTVHRIKIYRNRIICRCFKLLACLTCLLIENSLFFSRYPDIWKQLIDALTAAEQRNSDIMEATTSTRKRSKPVRAYKDIVEAQKKYLYRQRMKLERPDLYEQQKARDSYARSIRRMLKKQLAESQNIVNNLGTDINNMDNSVNNNINISDTNIDSSMNNNSDINEVHNVDINL